MANKIVLKKSSVVGRVPTPSDLEYGELALNYADGKLYYKTSLNSISSLGGSTNLTQIDRQSYTATAGQTTFAITYGVPYVDVYINGVHLSDEDYTATNGTSVILTEACTAGDQVDLVGYSGGVISAAPKANGDLLIYNSSTNSWENFPQASVTVGNANKWTTARTITLTGDVTGSVSIDGSANVSMATTVEINSITLGTDTTGNYVATVAVSGTGLSVTGSGSETAAVTITSNATSDNTASTLVSRDASGNFSAGTITAGLSGNATTATTLQTARNINGVSFNGSADVTVTTAGTGITVTGTTVAIDNTVATLTGTQTLSNKFLTDDSTIFQNYSDNTRRAYFSLLGISPNSIRIMTLPDQSTTLVGRSTTDTLSNKSLTSFDQKTGSTTIANQAVVQATVATTAQTAVDTFSASTYRSAKYIVQITQGTNYQSSEIMVLHNGTTTSTAEYAMMNTGGTLGTFSSDINGGNVRLLVTMASGASATINISRTTIVV